MDENAHAKFLILAIVVVGSVILDLGVGLRCRGVHKSFVDKAYGIDIRDLVGHPILFFL